MEASPTQTQVRDHFGLDLKILARHLQKYTTQSNIECLGISGGT